MKNYQRLRDIRVDRDLTQKDVAAILHMHYQQYARYENGLQAMGIDFYKTLAVYYNVSIDYLCGLTSEVRTLDGKPYQVSKNITIGSNNRNITIKN